MKILFVDHVSHLKTHSADFFVDILRESFEVELFYYERTYCFTIPKEKIDKADIIIFWEFLYNRRSLGIPGKRCIFVPMYDNEWGSKWQWKRIATSGMPVISFCDAITRHAKRHGVKNIIDVRYFPNPADLPQTHAKPKRVFLWERGDITHKAAEAIIPLHDGYVFDVKKADEFLQRTDYLQRIADCEIVVAPRMKEGIGMAFLEAMAMGKCVVAHDDATMNEYIENGKTGILHDFRKLGIRISAAEIEAVRANVKASAQRAYKRWQSDKNAIKPFIEAMAKLPPVKVSPLRDHIRYVLFLLEGAWHRIARSL